MNISSGLFSYQFSPKMRDSWGQNHVNHLETLKYVYTSGVISQRLYMSRYSLDTCFKDIIITVTMKIVSQQYILIPKELEIAISLISIVHALRKVSRLNNFQQLFGFFFFSPQGNIENYFYKSPTSIHYAQITWMSSYLCISIGKMLFSRNLCSRTNSEKHLPCLFCIVDLFSGKAWMTPYLWIPTDVIISRESHFDGFSP